MDYEYTPIGRRNTARRLLKRAKAENQEAREALNAFFDNEGSYGTVQERNKVFRALRKRRRQTECDIAVLEITEQIFDGDIRRFGKYGSGA